MILDKVNKLFGQRLLSFFPNEAAKRVQKLEENYEKNNKLRSIFFYTTHKCASTFIDKALDEIASNTGYVHIDYYGALWKLGDKIKHFNKDNIRQEDELFKDYGEIYGPLRNALEIRPKKDAVNIIFLRDPRDVLVSSYFSFGYSHGIPKNQSQRNKFLNKRKEITSMTIDQYVVNYAKSVINPLYTKYRELKEYSSYCYTLSYEMFFNDFDQYLVELEKAMSLQFSDGLRGKLYAHAKKPFSGKKGISEDIYSHHRSGKSEQFREKLKENTILELNEILYDNLQYWKFNI